MSDSKLAVFEECLTRKQDVTLREIASAFRARAGNSISLSDAMRITKVYRRTAVRRLNDNGMTVVNVDKDGNVAGAALRGRAGFGLKPTVALHRVDSPDDPMLTAQLDSWQSSAIGLRLRVETDIEGSIRHGVLSPKDRVRLLGDGS